MNYKKNSTAGETAMQVYTFNETDISIRIQNIDGNPWFVAKDLCNALELNDVRRAVEPLDDDEKLTGEILQSGQRRLMWLVNESGMYALVIRSNKPEAKKFRKWVTNEVLPSIRRTGSYTVQPAARRGRKTRGELVNADILNLLWLIGESLNHGDQKEIALELGVSVQSVSRTLNGYNRSNRILMALYKRARQNREAYMLYNQPALIADRLLKGTPIPEGNHLPAVKYDGRRGGQIGNQNARKNKGGSL